MTTKYRSLTLQLPSTEERDAWSRHLDELEAEMNKHIHQCQTHGVMVVNTPAGTITIKADQSLKPGEFRLEQPFLRCDQRAEGGQCVLGRGHRLDSEHHWNGEKEWPCFENGLGCRRQTSTHSSEMAIDAKRGTCSKCFVSPEVTFDPDFRCSHGLRPARREEFVRTPTPAPTKPDTFSVGDYVRLDIDGMPRLWTKGRITEVNGGRATMVVAERGPDWLPSAIGSERNAPLRNYKRCDPPTAVPSTFESAVTSPVVTREPAPPDPLDVEYDGAPLRKLLESDIAARHETNPFAGWMKPSQRAAVSAHWSAQLRAKVDASAAAERERERNRVVLDTDEDMPWRTW